MFSGLNTRQLQAFIVLLCKTQSLLLNSSDGIKIISIVCFIFLSCLISLYIFISKGRAAKISSDGNGLDLMWSANIESSPSNLKFFASALDSRGVSSFSSEMSLWVKHRMGGFISAIERSYVSVRLAATQLLSYWYTQSYLNHWWFPLQALFTFTSYKYCVANSIQSQFNQFSSSKQHLDNREKKVNS